MNLLEMQIISLLLSLTELFSNDFESKSIKLNRLSCLGTSIGNNLISFKGKTIYCLTWNMTSSSTDEFMGSELLPIAIRVCCPESPNNSPNKSEAPLITLG